MGINKWSQFFFLYFVKDPKIYVKKIYFVVIVSYRVHTERIKPL